ncbi:Nif11-like leader peptide family natural product precursor [Methylocystis parvus]|uniref:Nif11-like leader peptide family natural product n=1 Tax=Methylocystis parvus TaxID=134 RepID=A0A6B8MA43_9HYPH|nr:Nif11-like leader peptide family natural product precursor [Methylocystis parvus]QGM97530.1 Nif11-like leader peptide family natural product precursor [Methylocystis parvus]WBJ98545.1 Nif11-like leader peptide family natural product precursor [Methylocystis parvus OBBP]
MSVDSAVEYIRRMRSDDDFRKKMNEISDDEDASWAAIRDAGYDFTMIDFKKAQDVIYEEHGVTPM